MVRGDSQERSFVVVYGPAVESVHWRCVSSMCATGESFRKLPLTNGLFCQTEKGLEFESTLVPLLAEKGHQCMMAIR
eukprot:5950043-Amphidinium_carterae.1